MAAASGKIRAGKAFIEFFAVDGPLRSGLKKIEGKLRLFGDSVQGIGRSLAGLGAAAAVPLAGAVKSFISYEDALASLRANAQPTAEELSRIEEAAGRIGKAAGVGGAAAIGAMAELFKAGLDLESVLGGAAEAALQFARVAEMDAAEAAILLTDAMMVFGVDATRAVDALSKAADASSISVEQVAMAMSQGGLVARDAGLSIEEAANAIAILGQNGLKGSDAGTSLKTALLRLQTGAESAGVVMKQLGINVRNADGSMKDMRGIIAELEAGLGGLDAQARDTALLKLFGTDAIRAGSVLLKEGAEGWDRFAAAMDASLPVSGKFEVLMGTLTGQLSRLWASIGGMAVEIGGALAPAVASAVDRFQEIAEVVGTVVSKNKDLAVIVAASVAGVLGLAGGLIALGLAAKVAAIGFAVLGPLIGALLSPIGLTIAGVAAATIAFFKFSDAGGEALDWLGARFGDLAGIVTQTIGGMADAMQAGGGKADPVLDPLAGLAAPGALDASLNQSARKTDVAGSFSAAALAGLGAGDSVAKDQLNQLRSANVFLERIDDHLRDAGPLRFSSGL